MQTMTDPAAGQLLLSIYAGFQGAMFALSTRIDRAKTEAARIMLRDLRKQVYRAHRAVGGR